MWTAARVALALITAASMSGCGTVGNLWGDGCPGDRTVYGGVATSAAFVVMSAEQVARLDGLESCIGGALQGAYWLAVDLPLSAAADTLTLPITVHAVLEKRAADRAADRALEWLRQHPQEAGTEKSAAATKDAQR